MFSLLPLLVRILVREQESSCKQYFCMSTFIENPCTRTRKGGPRSRQSGGLPGELFMRILAREWENEKQRKKLRLHLKRPQQQKTSPGRWWFSLHLKDMISPYTRKTKARDTGRGPPGSTIIIYKELIRFNNNNNHFISGPPRFLPTRSSSSRGLPPPLRGGNSSSKESPALPIPSYPALCREDTTSWKHGRPSIHPGMLHPASTSSMHPYISIMPPLVYKTS